MLSQSTRDTIKATIPVLEENGEALTRHFYQRMFTQDPEVKAFFNPAHQHAGTQQKALAAAILAYAKHIDDPAALAGAIDLIAHKHVSLGVAPEHYPIVGRNLLGAIRELLGEAATDEIINAWGEAYQVLADACIAREAEIYREQRETHGWVGFKPFTVDRVVDESELIRSFHLKPSDGQPLRPFKPGQYLTVRFPSPETGTTMRNYSLSSAPRPDHFRISVKREDATRADAPHGFVSHRLHGDIAAGDEIEVSPPAGNFTLEADADDDRPLVLLSGGVGITPLMAMLEASGNEAPHRPVGFFHAALHGGVHAFRGEVDELAARCPGIEAHYRYSEPRAGDLERGRCHSTGFVDAAVTRSLTPSNDADFYYCGPRPFMAAVDAALDELGVAPERRRYEFFGPAQSLRQAS